MTILFNKVDIFSKAASCIVILRKRVASVRNHYLSDLVMQSYSSNQVVIEALKPQYIDIIRHLNSYYYKNDKFCR